MILRMFRVLLLSLFLAGFVFAGDISGNWEFTVETSAGSGTPSFVFQQTGEKLTGTYTGMLGTAKLNGTVKGDQVEFSFAVSQDGQSGTVTYKGSIVSATKMKGTVKLAELGEGTWEGTKK